MCSAAVAIGCGSSHHHAAIAERTPHFAEDHFLPGGIRTVAEGRVPHGPAFAISAERYRFEGRIYVDLATQMEPHAALQGGESSFSPDPSSAPLTWSAEEGCSKHPPVSWSILYGLLSDRADRASVYMARRWQVVQTAAIPASIHSRGLLGYALLTEAPGRVLVRDAAGHVVQDESLGLLPKERCTPGATGGLMVVHAAKR